MTDIDDAPGATEWAVPGAVGVGPWAGEWPADDRYDPELLAHGDRRNVVDGYRYWRRDAVAADLARRGHPFHVAIENFGHDHNIGTVVRTANAFAAAGAHRSHTSVKLALPPGGHRVLPSAEEGDTAAATPAQPSPYEPPR